MHWFFLFLDPEHHGIAISNYPLTSKFIIFKSDLRTKMFLEIIKTIGVFALSFTAASSTSITRERQCGSFGMQLLAGQKRIIYWTMSYIWDAASLLIPMLIILIVFIIFNETAYIGREHIGGFICLMLVYGLVITPMMYCLTFAFSFPSVAFVALLAVNILIVFITTFVVRMVQLISFSDPSFETIHNVLAKVFLIFPQFALAQGFYVLSRRNIIHETRMEIIMGDKNIWAWENLPEKIVAMLVEMVVFYGYVLISYTSGAGIFDKCLLNQGYKRKKAMERKGKEDISEDVLKESERVRIVSRCCFCNKMHFLLKPDPSTVNHSPNRLSEMFSA